MLLAGAALAQAPSGRISGPVLGLVFDRAAGAVRPLAGIPGAATLGAPLAQGSGLQNAAVSGEAAYAIAQETESGNVVVVSSNGRSQLAGAAPGSNAVVSPRGAAAVLYSKDSTTAQVFTGMPDAPQLAWQIDLGTPPLSLAVSDDGATLVAILPQGRTAQAAMLYRAGSAGQILLSDRRFSAIQFIPGTSQLIAAASSTLVVISPTSTEVLARGREGFRGIAAVGASSDGAKIFAAAAAGGITIFDRTTGLQSAVACSCAVTGLARLRGNAVFRLNERIDGPIWLLDADAPEPRVVFVASGTGENQ